jgi:hypothetical protein
MGVIEPGRRRELLRQLRESGDQPPIVVCFAKMQAGPGDAAPLFLLAYRRFHYLLQHGSFLISTNVGASLKHRLILCNQLHILNVYTINIKPIPRIPTTRRCHYFS